jgi:hypothetical protein
MTTATKHMADLHSEPVTSSETISTHVAGYAYSYAITSLVSAVLVVLKESSPAVHDFLTSITGNHWITHSLFDIILFVALGWWFTRSELVRTASANTVIGAIVGSTVVSGLIIAGYFLL